MRTSSILFAVSTIFLAGGSMGALLFLPSIEVSSIAPRAVTSFDECVSAGNPVMESFPRQCRDEAGNLFTEEFSELPPRQDVGDASPQENIAWIEITSPTPGRAVMSPLEVTGVLLAPLGTTSAPALRLIDETGGVISENTAIATTIMPDGNLSFSATLSWTTVATGTGTLIASDERGEFTVPVSF